MSGRELVVLGTSAQVPTRHRNHNGYLLRFDGEGVLFDPGEGTQRQLLLAGVPVSAVTRICITHFHGDHCLGLPGVLQRMSLDRVPHPVAVCYPASGSAHFDRLRRASIFDEAVDLTEQRVTEAGARRLVLTHFSQRYPDVEAFLDEARPIFPEVEAATDLARFALPGRR